MNRLPKCFIGGELGGTEALDSVLGWYLRGARGLFAGGLCAGRKRLVCWAEETCVVDGGDLCAGKGVLGLCSGGA